MNVLDEGAKANSDQDSWWWLKADGCDLLGLKESTKMEWSGDVDLPDGSLQIQYEKYRQHMKHAEKVGLNSASA